MFVFTVSHAVHTPVGWFGTHIKSLLSGALPAVPSEISQATLVHECNMLIGNGAKYYGQTDVQSVSCNRVNLKTMPTSSVVCIRYRV